MAIVTPTTHDSLSEALAADLDVAFPRMVRETIDGLYSGVRRLNPDAEDVVQDTYLRAYRALSDYDPARIRCIEIRPWLWTIAINRCRNLARDAGRRPMSVELTPAAEIAPGGPSPEDEAMRSAELEVWRHRLEELSDPMRSAVVLRHVAGLTYAEIAKVLGRPLGTVKADVHRAIRTLRTHIEQEENHGR